MNNSKYTINYRNKSEKYTVYIQIINGILKNIILLLHKKQISFTNIRLANTKYILQNSYYNLSTLQNNEDYIQIDNFIIEKRVLDLLFSEHKENTLLAINIIVIKVKEIKKIKKLLID